MAYLAKTSAKGIDYYKLMESYREGGKVKHRVILNIGPWKKLSQIVSKAVVLQNNSPSQESAGADEFSSSSDSNAPVQPVVEKAHCRIHGAPFALYEVAEWTGVERILNDVFPPQVSNGCSRGKAILLSAIQRACASRSKAQFSNWFAETSLPEYLLPDDSGFTSQVFRDQMDGIDVNKLREAETRIVNRLFELFPDEPKEINLLALDYTNYCKVTVSVNRERRQSVIDKFFGNHALFTIRFDEGARQINIDYRPQECVERLFSDYKDTENFSLRPIYHRTEDRVVVHFFICTLAMTLSRVLHHMLKKSGAKISCLSMMKKLNQVHECHMVFANPSSKNIRSLRTSQKVIAEMRPDIKELWDTTQSVLKTLKKGVQ